MVEIFQWKGQLEIKPDEVHLTAEETVHIGEEIADVFIYSTRLSDICGIDLAQAVVSKVQPGTSSMFIRQVEGTWSSMELDSLITAILPIKESFRSQRHVCFSLQSVCGRLCEVFGRYAETDSTAGLPAWAEADVEELSGLLGDICIRLGCLAHFSGISLSQCVTDKFAKNARKYPADKSRGSSAKYTEYAEEVAEAERTEQDQTRGL